METNATYNIDDEISIRLGHIAPARNSDSVTSHDGRGDVAPRIRGQKWKLLQAYNDHPDGLTDEEAARIAGLLHTGYWKRCSELRVVGCIRPNGQTRAGCAGSQQMVCLPVPLADWHPPVIAIGGKQR